MSAVVLRGDAAHLPLPDASADLICTSPPYFGLRSYTDDGGHYDGQIGSEETPREYIAALLDCTREWMRVLKPSGSIFVNLGDKYSGAQQQADGPMVKARSSSISSAEHYRRMNPKNTGIPTKCLLGLPWRFALACTDELGLILRRDIIWSKPNGLPESVTDRCRSSHEYLFHLVKQPRYYAAVDEIREPHAPAGLARRAYPFAVNDAQRASKNPVINGAGDKPSPLGKLPGSVWEIPSQPLTVPPALGVDHFAAFPMELPRRIILGWSPSGICTACGEGRRPVVDRTIVPLRPGDRPGIAGLNGDRAHGFDRRAGTHMLSQNTIIGYACACTPFHWREDETARWKVYHFDRWTPPPTRPALVVDPFGGTGTAALVASMLGRTGISVDRSADYCRLAVWRTRDPAERARALGVPKPPPVPEGQASLFDEAS